MKWLSPPVLGVMVVLIGWSLVSGGVFLLFGQAWTLICASAPFLLFGYLIFRGLARAE